MTNQMINLCRGNQASEHKTTANTNQSGKNEKDSKKTVKQPPQPWMKKETYKTIFNDSFQGALQDISKNPLHNLFGKSPISEIAEYCENDIFFSEQAFIIFRDLTDLRCNIALSDDRETLFTKLHTLRLSEDIHKLVEEMKKKETPFPEEINNFVQVFLMNMTKCLIENMTKLMKKECKKETTNLSENEQKVLFYIAGYIIHALNKRYSKSGTRINKQKLKHVLEFSTGVPSDATRRYVTMIKKKDKGGLKIPRENFFLLIRSMERIVNCKQTLDKNILKEALMEDFMVKYYIERLCNTIETVDEESECAVSGLLEDICHIFLTIRGFAMAKLKRNKFIRSEKTGNSFRATLKEKCTNVTK